MDHTPRYKLGVYQARKEGPHFALISVFQGLRIGFVKVTAQIGVVSPAQVPKWYSRLRPESFPPSAQASHNFWTQTHESPETVLIPIGSDFPHFAFDPHQQSHRLSSQFAIRR